MVTILLPTYNEKDNLPALVRKILQLDLNDIEVLIIDDNSPDGTGEIADNLKKEYSNVKVLHRTGERGLGSAIKAGFEKSESDIIGVMDTDLSHDASILPEIINQMKHGADFVIGSRYTNNIYIDAKGVMRRGGIKEWTFLRRLVSRIATLMVKPLTRIKDPMSGFFFIKKDVIRQMNINPNSCKICLDIIVRGQYKRVVEVPYIFTNRKRGKTKIFTINEMLKYLSYIVFLYKYKLSRHD